MLNVFLTFDTEIWCDGWEDLDAKFPDAFRRYVYGPTRKGDYALPATLDILAEHGLRGVFFVEPLFAARFGQAPLDELVGLIRRAGQEIQLHLHTEWVDEADDPELPQVDRKHQYLRQFDRTAQAQLIRYGAHRLNMAGVEPITAFRAGGYGFNRDTLLALADNRIPIDSSYNAGAPIGTADVAPGGILHQPQAFGPVVEYPVSTFHDGRGRRHLQLTACSLREFEHLLWQAVELGWESLVIVSHNFELLDGTKTRPDPVVVGRFQRLCRFLAAHPESFRVRGFGDIQPAAGERAVEPLRSGLWRTGLRVVEQAARRVLHG